VVLILYCGLELLNSKWFNYSYKHIAIFLKIKIISTFLSTVVKPFRIKSLNPQYKIRTTNLKGNILLEQYLYNYPLFGTKSLDYKDWLKVLNFLN